MDRSSLNSFYQKQYNQQFAIAVAVIIFSTVLLIGVGVIGGYAIGQIISSMAQNNGYTLDVDLAPMIGGLSVIPAAVAMSLYLWFFQDSRAKPSKLHTATFSRHKLLKNVALIIATTLLIIFVFFVVRNFLPN